MAGDREQNLTPCHSFWCSTAICRLRLLHHVWHAFPMTKCKPHPVLAALFSCVIAGCSSQTLVGSIEAPVGKSISVALEPETARALEKWKSCYSRRVWIEAKGSDGKARPPVYTCVFPAESDSKSETSINDPVQFKLSLEGDANGGIILRNSINYYSAIWLKSSGVYSLVFHVDCYNRKHQTIYVGTTAIQKIHIPKHASSNNATATASPEINLVVGQK